MKKKITTLLLAATIVTGTLLAVGCASKTSTDTTTTTATATESSATTDNSSAATGSSSKEDSSSDAAASGEVKKITIATGGMPKPFTYVDEKDNLTGYDIELAKAVFAKLPQYELKFQVTEFPSIFAGLDSGLYQVGANNFAMNEARKQKYIYSDPIFENQFVIAVAENNTTINSFTDLAGKTSEVQSGVNFTTALENYNKENPDKAVKLTYTDSELVPILQNVESGADDFQLIDQAMLNTYIKEYGLKLKVISLTAEEQQLISSSNYSYFLVGKGDGGEQLATDINKALAEVIADGTAGKISEQFFGADFSPKSK